MSAVLAPQQERSICRKPRPKKNRAFYRCSCAQVSDDIANRLDIPSRNVVRTPFYRRALSLRAVRAPDDQAERIQLLVKHLLNPGRAGGAAVVYVTLQRTAVEVADALVAAGLEARPYHAGLPPAVREASLKFIPSRPFEAARCGAPWRKGTRMY